MHYVVVTTKTDKSKCNGWSYDRLKGQMIQSRDLDLKILSKKEHKNQFNYTYIIW